MTPSAECHDESRRVNNSPESTAHCVTSQEGRHTPAYWHPTIHRIASALPVYAPGWYAPSYPFCDYSLRQSTEEIRSAEARLELENAMLRLPRLVRSSVNHKSIFENLHSLPEHLVQLKRRRLYDTPPLIGYQGHVPQLLTTDAGLGVRYSEAARLSLELFRERTARRASSSSSSLSLSPQPVAERSHWHYLTVPHCLN